jgi:uncharacterized protein
METSISSDYSSSLIRETTTRPVNELFPVFLKANQLTILLIGGGNVALEKLQAILENSPKATVTVVAERFSDAFVQFAEQQAAVELIEDVFRTHHLEGFQLVLSAVNSEKLSAEIREKAAERGILYNAADKPELCDFYLGSVVTKGNLKIGISTNGKSPTIAKRLKEVLQEELPAELDESVSQLSRFRSHLKGDFRRKVLALNKVTAALNRRKEQPWYLFSFRRIIGYVLGVLAVMLAGHLLVTLLPLETIALSASEAVASLDESFLYFMLGGFIAQMIDGALGMAYGVSATTFLLSFGVSPAVASMSVHTSEIFTSGVSGFLHLRFGNVNNKLFRTLLIPGVVGAILGAYVLTEFESYNTWIRPAVGCYTLILGCIILYKVVRKRINRRKVKHVGWLATAGGFLDAIGGGGWGPVVSSTLIARGKNPRIVIGSVNLAEFFVSVASSFTFFTLIGGAHWQIFTGLILGGVCAAPIAAHLSRKLNVKAMMLMVGIVIIIVSLRIIVMTFV